MIVYDKLWETMKKKGITQYALIKKYNISPGQITRLKRNESVSTHTIDMFCEILDCKVEDILEFKKSVHEQPLMQRLAIDNLLILAKFYDVSLDYITGASNIKTEYPKEQATG